MRRQTLNNILYVEDDDDLRALTRIALEAVGRFSLKACGSGQEALDTVSAGYEPDLLLLDMLMPGMDGPATLEGLRDLPATSATPTIFLTGKSQASDIAYCKSLGAIGVIPKPFDPMQLAQQVRALWEQADA